MRQSTPSDYDARVEAAFFRRLPLALNAVLVGEEAEEIGTAIANGAADLLGCEDAWFVEEPPDDLLSALRGLVHERSHPRDGAEEEPRTATVVLAAHGLQLGHLVLRRGPEKPPFSHQERGLIRYFADLAALALHSAHLRVELERLAYTDSLTGLANRRRLIDELERLVGEDIPYSLFLLDVDGLKEVNDTLGYEHGDKLLTTVAEAFAGQMREGELAARLGGDEFVASLPRLTRREEEKRQEALHSSLTRAALPKEIVAHYRGASVGIVRAKRGEPTVATLRRAAAKMREQKRGR